MRCSFSIKRAPRAACSGQILVEACLGLALLGLAWMLLTHALFMSENRVRTALAARHVAWMVGNEPSVTNDMAGLTARIESQFFLKEGLLKVKPVKSLQGGGGGVSGILSDATARMDGGQHRFEVRFGLDRTELATTEVYPFVLLNTRMPFMPDTLLTNALSVSSRAQWAEVNRTWDDVGDLLNALMKAFKFW